MPHGRGLRAVEPGPVNERPLDFARGFSTAYDDAKKGTRLRVFIGGVPWRILEAPRP